MADTQKSAPKAIFRNVGLRRPTGAAGGILARPLQTRVDLGVGDLTREVHAPETLTIREKQALIAVDQQGRDRLDPCVIVGTTIKPLTRKTLEGLQQVIVRNPRHGGPKKTETCNDPKMGTLENDQVCGTCHATNMDCPGHLGMIKLPEGEGIIHPLFYEEVIWLLTCVCNSCSSLLVSKTTMEQEHLLALAPRARLKALAKKCEKGVVCYKLRQDGSFDSSKDQTAPCRPELNRSCEANPKYDRKVLIQEQQIKYTISRPDGSSITSNRKVSEVEQIFKYICDSDLRLLGYDPAVGVRPTDYIMHAIPVIPIQARPMAVHDGEITDDSLTITTSSIVAAVEEYSKATKADARAAVMQRVASIYSHMIDKRNDASHAVGGKTATLDIGDRLKTKEGIIRGSMMGKRVNYCGRTVAGPCSDLRLGWFAIPKMMARFLTVKEKVHRYNLNEMRLALREGNIMYIFPGKRGANTMTGVRWTVSAKMRNNSEQAVQEGDVVCRFLVKGDMCLFNRQPTLHKQSIMGAHIHIWSSDNLNFGLHMSCTKPLNADFDGDELNLHIPQTIESQVEARFFAHVDYCIINAQNNSVLIGVVYNSLTAGYIMTRPGIADEDKHDAFDPDLQTRTSSGEIENRFGFIFDSEEWAEGLEVIERATVNGWSDRLQSLQRRLAKQQIPAQTGYAMFSLVLPEDLWYDGPKGVKIRDGVLVAGTITKAHIGPVTGSIIQSIWKWSGPRRTSQFITEVTFLMDWFIEMHGFSIGFGDCVAPNRDVNQKILSNIIAKAELDIRSLGPETADMGQLELETREESIRGFVNNTSRIGKETVEQLSTNNALVVMMLSGAKGDVLNTAQMMTAVGQQYVKGERPQPNLFGRRCLPYCRPGSTDIMDNGFIPDSYLTGISPKALIFLAMAARIGLLDTATKTAESGYMQHRVVRALDGVTVHYDGSVRNPNGVIFTFCYGGDGMDAAQLIQTTSPQTGDLASFINLKEAAGRINSTFDEETM